MATDPQILEQQPIFETMGSRKAPLRVCDDQLEEPFRLKQGAFAVFLFPGHSFEDHSRVVGTDMTPYVQYDFSEHFPGQIVYSCEDVGDDLLEAIRNDPGVEWVDCNVEPGAIVPETEEEWATSNKILGARN
ncbi:hypothetical protein BDV96DRAFT_643022 [Lophiotrema nucula]|uniref:Uncharacterized protein n=1 Tax=Lophiotrema nucula TaxID=690887 RepID=A0A6A5ZH98_9PLEO|nr:hypothetical protein BDV96DRAFT_643022 [Lophiotrema nucula]